MFRKELALKDFEFYYLVELTRQKLKPLSRWEKPTDDKIHKWLTGQGLFVENIRRKTHLRRTVYETVFSTSSHYVDFYSKKFLNAPLRRDVHTQQLEGFFFGYPACCVRQFIHQPYAPNRLSQAEQSLLFHWACQNCRVTPELFTNYKTIHAQVKEWYEHAFPSNNPPEVVYGHNYLKKCQTALATLLLYAGLVSAQSNPDTTHYVPLPNDRNANGLSYAEEVYLGAYEYSTLEDCQTWAKLFRAIIDSLPNTVQTDQAYKLEYPMRGVVQCPKCGENINMGYIVLVNPLRDLTLDIPYLGLHFMANGYFSYGTSQDFRRVDIDTLKQILYPFDPNHMLRVAGDSDGDGLTDAEEDSLSLDNAQNIQDFDRDGVPDGAQIAEELIRLFPKLSEEIDNIHSSIEWNPVLGSELCQVCGSRHNMGTIKITNPENKRSCQIPYLSLHALAHGSFAYDGTVHQSERTDAVELYRVMKTHMLFISDDTDNDGLKDDEEDDVGFAPDNPDSNGDGICDGTQLALSYADTIKSLPTEPRTDGPYVEYLGMYGIHRCSVCGDEFVMGVRRIFNPLLNTPLPLEISNYAFHFLENGSFAFEGDLEGRISPKELSDYLGDIVTDIKPDQANKIPSGFVLEQNYPNPFNPETRIRFKIPRASYVTLRVYNSIGQEVRRLINQKYEAGLHSIRWDSKDNHGNLVTSGLYFYQLQADKFSQVLKMTLLK